MSKPGIDIDAVIFRGPRMLIDPTHYKAFALYSFGLIIELVKFFTRTGERENPVSCVNRAGLVPRDVKGTDERTASGYLQEEGNIGGKG